MRSGYLGAISGWFGTLRGAPGVMDGCCTTLGGEGGGINQKDLTGDRFQVTVPLFSKSKVSFQIWASYKIENLVA